MATVYSSTSLSPGLLDRLLVVLGDAHRERPLLPDAPRDVVHRAEARMATVGLRSVRIRGTVSYAGVEVDHVWLAVSDDSHTPFVVDAAFPLHVRAFAEALAGYVAGTVTSADLVAVAEGTRLEDRVIGSFPAVAGYRGQPYWGLVA